MKYAKRGRRNITGILSSPFSANVPIYMWQLNATNSVANKTCNSYAVRTNCSMWHAYQIWQFCSQDRQMWSWANIEIIFLQSKVSKFNFKHFDILQFAIIAAVSEVIKSVNIATSGDVTLVDITFWLGLLNLDFDIRLSVRSVWTIWQFITQGVQWPKMGPPSIICCYFFYNCPCGSLCSRNDQTFFSVILKSLHISSKLK